MGTLSHPMEPKSELSHSMEPKSEPKSEREYVSGRRHDSSVSVDQPERKRVRDRDDDIENEEISDASILMKKVMEKIHALTIRRPIQVHGAERYFKMVYEEPSHFGTLMKPGKNSSRWGPSRWYTYSTRIFIMLYDYSGDIGKVRELHRLPKVYIRSFALWLEFQPFVLPCGLCRGSLGVAVSKKKYASIVKGIPFIQSLEEFQMFLNYARNRVNRRHNKNPSNAALPRKPIVSYSEHVKIYKEALQPFLEMRPPATEPPDYVIAVFFKSMYYETEHYPDKYLDDPLIERRRLHHRISFALWCDLWPEGSYIHNCWNRQFSLGLKFQQLHRREFPPASIEELMEMAKLIPPNPSVWASSERLTATVHHLECQVRGVYNVVPLIIRKQIVQRSVVTTLPDA